VGISRTTLDGTVGMRSRASGAGNDVQKTERSSLSDMNCEAREIWAEQHIITISCIVEAQIGQALWLARFPG
jgi:hypothetical protein